MAVISTSNPTGLKIKFNCGKDELTGNTIMKNKTYSNIKPDALDQDMFDVANVLASLQSYSIEEISRVDNITLSK